MEEDRKKKQADLREKMGLPALDDVEKGGGLGTDGDGHMRPVTGNVNFGTGQGPTVQ